MPSVLSIEAINLNGSILTAYDNRLYIDGMQVKNTSGVQLTDRYFLRGYAPISFYSRWPVVGNYLNEIYISDFFMATGFLVTCSHPATGDEKLEGSFYVRRPESVIDTKYVGAFTLDKYQYSSNGGLNYKITPHNVLGLNIHSTANEIRSISISLLGYYSAAASFDKIPVSFNYYNDDITIKENIYEQYIQYPAEFTGWGIYCSKSGAGSSTFTDYITGYISGILENNEFRSIHTGSYPPNTSGFSGYFLYPYELIKFPTGGDGMYQFEAFDNQINRFFAEYGYEYSGFFPSNSGFSGTQFPDSGLGMMTGIIGYRNLPTYNPLSGKFYKKNKHGIKEYLIDFGIDAGQVFAETSAGSEISFEIDGGDRIGIDILSTLSGISGVNIALGGFYK